MSAKPLATLGRISAPLVGAPITAFLIGAAAIAGANAVSATSTPLAFAVGLHAIVPLWVALGCTLPLARSTARAWRTCLALAFPALVVLTVTWIR